METYIFIAKHRGKYFYAVGKTDGCSLNLFFCKKKFALGTNANALHEKMPGRPD